MTFKCTNVFSMHCNACNSPLLHNPEASDVRKYVLHKDNFDALIEEAERQGWEVVNYNEVYCRKCARRR